LKAKEVLRLLKITRPTLSNYIKMKYISGYKKPNGQYEYNDSSIYDFLNKGHDRVNVIYSRVSTSNQKNDLERQIQNLVEYTSNRGINISKIYSDIGSGMNYDRKDFNKLLEQVLEYKIKNIFISYKDRFGRTAYKALEKLFNSYGTEIIPIQDIGITKSTEKEFLEEIISLIHSFSMKMYSARRKKKLELIKEDLKLESEI